MQKLITLFTLAAAAAFLTACNPGPAPEEEGSAGAANSGDELIVPIEGMVCMACVSRVKRTLRQMEGVTFAEANLAEGHVRVRSDENAVTSDEIVEAIREMGYKSEKPEAPEGSD